MAAPLFGPEGEILGSLGMVLDDQQESVQHIAQSLVVAAADINAALARAGQASWGGRRSSPIRA